MQRCPGGVARLAYTLGIPGLSRRSCGCGRCLNSPSRRRRSKTPTRARAVFILLLHLRKHIHIASIDGEDDCDDTAMSFLKQFPVSAVGRSTTFRPATVRLSRPLRQAASPVWAVSARRHMASAGGGAASDPRLSLMDASCLSDTQRQVREAVFRVCADFPDVRYYGGEQIYRGLNADLPGILG